MNLEAKLATRYAEVLRAEVSDLSGIRKSWRVPAFVSFLTVGALAVAAFSVATDDHFRWGTALTFGILAFLSEQFPVTSGRGSFYSVTFVITIAAIIVAGPAVAAVASGFAAIPLLRRKSPIKVFFNLGEFILSTAAAAYVYKGLGGPVGEYRDILPEVILPLAAATATDFVISSALVSGVISLREKTQFLRLWGHQFADLWRGYLAFAPLGLLLAVLYQQKGMGAASVLFLLVPLLVARTAFQAAVKMQGAYDATVRSLVKAVEEKDKFTRGHAGRVATLSQMVAHEYGLSEDQIRAIYYAALMHDVGKLGVETPILQKKGKLTPEEYERMKLHPIRGYEIVRGIEFLGPAIDAIRHHHERLDGMGYPDGLAGEQIPLIARLIMVADAFDSMTSTRTYRPPKTVPQAFVELRRCGGTQFDERAIDALERAIEKLPGGWHPEPEPRQEADEALVHS